MDTSTRWNIYRWIYRMFYLFGLILLLTGMLLSMVSSPAQAGNLRTVSETATSRPPFRKQPVSRQPVQQKGVSSGSSRPEARSQGFGLPPAQLTQMPTLSQLPPGTGSVRFLTPDTPVCMLGPGSLEATVEVSLPAGVSAILQTAYHIVEPPDLRTDTVYYETSVVNGDRVTVSGQWPGVRPGDQVVEIHFGAMLLDPGTKNPISSGAGIDYYWYPWSCTGPTSPPLPTVEVGQTATATLTEFPTAVEATEITITPTSTATFTATVTTVPSETPTATLPPPTVEVGETATRTPTMTVTSIPSATPTPTVTLVASDTPTATVTLASSDTPTATATLPPPTVEAGETSTSTPTVTATVTETATQQPPTLQAQTATLTPTRTPTRTRTPLPPTVEAGETATSTPPPTITVEGPTAVAPSEEVPTVGVVVNTATATLERPTPIVIVVTATSEIPVTGLQEVSETPTRQPGPVQAPAATGQSLIPVTGADLANRPLSAATLPFWQRFATYAGLLMLGIGLIMQGLGKKG